MTCPGGRLADAPSDVAERYRRRSGFADRNVWEKTRRFYGWASAGLGFGLVALALARAAALMLAAACLGELALLSPKARAIPAGSGGGSRAADAAAAVAQTASSVYVQRN